MGTWSGIGNTYTCQWQRSSDGGTTWTNIAGATAFSYTIAVADEGSAIRALITAVNPDGTASTGSAATPTITAGAAGRGQQPRDHRRPAARRHAELHPGPVDGHRQRLLRPVAALGRRRHHVDEHHRRHLRQLHADDRRRGRRRAPAHHRGQPRRHGRGAQQRDGDGDAPRRRSTPPRPAISGAPQRGLLLNSAVGTWNGIGDAFTFQWQRSADGTHVDEHHRRHRRLLPAGAGRRGRHRCGSSSPAPTRTARARRRAPRARRWPPRLRSTPCRR